MLREELQLIDNLLSADTIDDADKGIFDGDENKKHVFIRADESDHDSQDNVDKVEESESVFRDNFKIGTNHKIIIACLVRILGAKGSDGACKLGC